MAVTVKAVLRRTKTKNDGTAPVWIRLTANRRTRFLSTGIYIRPKHWNEKKQRVRATHEIAPALNQRLESLLIDAKTAALEADTAAEVKASLEGSGGSFTDFFQAYIDDLEAASRYWQARKFPVTLRKLQACFGKRIAWQDLLPGREKLTRWEKHMRKEEGLHVNTIRKELQRLRRVIRQAIKEGVIKPEADPFLTYDRPKAVPTNRRKLSEEEIEALREVDLKGRLAVARDVFLFAFYAGGMRFGDVCRLKGRDVQRSRVEYRMAKTNSPMSVPLPPPGKQLLEAYRRGPNDFLFPLLKPGDDSGPVKVRKKIASHNAKVNERLKEVAERAGIEPEGLSMHVARHSFADYARRHSDNLYAISKTLGHKSLQVTETYLKSFDRDAVDQLANELWEEK